VVVSVRFGVSDWKLLLNDEEERTTEREKLPCLYTCWSTVFTLESQ
jgi:hypothetical protein